MEYCGRWTGCSFLRKIQLTASQKPKVVESATFSCMISRLRRADVVHAAGGVDVLSAAGRDGLDVAGHPAPRARLPRRVDTRR